MLIIVFMRSIYATNILLFPTCFDTLRRHISEISKYAQRESILCQKEHIVYGHGSTRGLSSNSICTTLNIIHLMHLDISKLFFWRKKKIFGQVGALLMAFVILSWVFKPKNLQKHVLALHLTKNHFFSKNVFKCLNALNGSY